MSGDDDPRRNRSLGGGSGGTDEEGDRDDEHHSDDTHGDGSDHESEEPLGDDAAPGADAPLSDLRRDVDERREHGHGDDDDDAFEELFAEMEVGDVDEDAVWAELEESAEEPVVDPDAVTADTGTAERADGDVTIVEKSLCHGCPHFADPPETACTHDGTTIAAEVDTGHFRVVDCPVVAEREAREDPSDFSADPE